MIRLRWQPPLNNLSRCHDKRLFVVITTLRDKAC